MTLDDDSILSAYLDGQLGPEEHQAVESALCADPRLAEELRSLATLRDLVAGLPREEPTDLTARVMRRVRHARRGRAARAIAWAPARAAAIVAIAAGAIALAARVWLPHAAHAPGRQGQAPAVARLDGSGPAARPGLSERLWPRFADHRSREGSRPEPVVATDGHGHPRPADSSAADTDRQNDDLVHVREYLDNPRLRRIFVVADLQDGSATRQVTSIVEQTTRFNFYRFTISQGIVIDPRHPDRATVFALAVGPRELDGLRHSLQAALRGRVEEADVNPEVVAQLAEIGQVEACRPSPMPGMAIPHDALALQDEPNGDAGNLVEPPPAPAGAQRADRPPPTPEQERSSPRFGVASGARRKAPDADAGPRPGPPGPVDASEEPDVVLVWVARPRPG